MAKGNGGTRVSNPSNMYGGGNASVESFPAWMSEAGWNDVLNDLQAENYPSGWQDIDPDHRELALMEAGFTGLASDGAEDIITEVSKDHILSYVSDEILNRWLGQEGSNDIMITVGHTDGKTYTDEEIEPSRKITDRQSYATQKNIIKQTMTGRDVSFVLVQGPWGSNYWAAKGNDHIQQHTGYERWKNGRGEKRRDYVQDDWI